MRRIKACGILLFRNKPTLEFLLMRHSNRWDLPKGHLESGESEIECALREMQEETGIKPADVILQPDFRFATQYTVHERRLPGSPALKTLVIFMAATLRPVEIVATEHLGSTWLPWAPPHRIQSQTIDGVLEAAERFLRSPRGHTWSTKQLAWFAKGE